MAKPVIQALQGRKTSTPPIWLMRQAGRYLPEYRDVRAKAGSFLTLCYTPELAAEVTLQPIRRFGFDAAIIFADILLVPDALGQKLWFEDNHGPRLEPLDGVRGLGHLSLDRVSLHLAPVYEAVAKVRAQLPAETALIGFAGAPWTVATYMCEGKGSQDHAAARSFAYRDGAGFAQLMDLLVEATIVHLLAQIEAGADVVQLFDTWAGALDEDGFARWCTAPARRIVDALKDRHPHVPVIGFPRGAGARLEAYVRDSKVDGIGLDSGVPLDYARRMLQPHGCVQGNLDPLRLVAGGASLHSQVRAICDAWHARPFIFNLGHGIVPQTPIEHVEALVKLVRDRTS